MTNLRRKIAVFAAFIMAFGMFSMSVTASDVTEPLEELAITKFQVENKDGIITESEHGNTIVVEGLPCGTDMTSLVVEVWYPMDAMVELVDDERLDGRRRDTDPLLPDEVNFTNARTFRLSRGEEVKDYLVTVKTEAHQMKEASCTEKAVCEVCGYEEGECLGHDFGAWEVTKKSTFTEKGEEKRTCNRCGYEEVRDIERLNRIAEAGKNKIEKLEAGKNYFVNQKIVFCAVGDGMNNANPVNKDTRFVPVKWRIGLQNTWKNFSGKTAGEAEFQIGETGNYRLHVCYQEEIFQDEKWTPTGKTDIREVKFQIIEQKKEETKQKEKEENKTNRKPAVKTDDSNDGKTFFVFGITALASALAGIEWKRRIR